MLQEKLWMVLDSLQLWLFCSGIVMPLLPEAHVLLALIAVSYALIDAESSSGMRSLTVPPEENETMQLDFTIVSLPGNAINLTNYISIDPMRVYYTAANWSTEVVLLVNGESEFLACLAIKSIAVSNACEAHAFKARRRLARLLSSTLAVLHASDVHLFWASPFSEATISVFIARCSMHAACFIDPLISLIVCRAEWDRGRETAAL